MGDDPTRTLQDFTRQISVRWQALWQDYRDAKSLEARVIKQADALDCVLQAIAYRQLYRAPLADFQGLLSKASGDDEALHDFLQQAWAETEAPALGTKA